MYNWSKHILLIIFVSIVSSFNLSAQDKSSLDLERFNIYIQKANSFKEVDIDSVIYYMHKAEDVSKGIDNDSIVSIINISIGGAYFFQGNYGVSLDYYYKELNRSVISKDSLRIALANFNIGKIRLMNHQWKESIKNFDKTLELIPNSFLYSDLGASAYTNSGIAYQRLNDFENAEVRYLEGLRIGNKINSLSVKGDAYSNLGTLEEINGNYDKALEYFFESLKVRKEEGSSYRIALSKGHIGQIYFIQNKNDKAVDYLKQTLAITERLNSDHISTYVYDLLEKISLKEYKYQEAYSYLRQRHDLDSVITHKYQKDKLSLLKSKYDNELSKEMELARSKEREFKLVIIAIIFILIAVITFFFYSSNKQKMVRKNLIHQRTELKNDLLAEELEHKKKEVMTKVMYLVKKNEFIQAESNELSLILGKLKKENKALLLPIIKRLNQVIDKDVWVEFETYFNSINDTFYESLNIYDLTSNERRLCAFLKLDMSSKEISSITGQSLRSIEVARYRLRKKFDLSNSTISLYEFLVGL